MVIRILSDYHLLFVVKQNSLQRINYPPPDTAGDIILSIDKRADNIQYNSFLWVGHFFKEIQKFNLLERKLIQIYIVIKCSDRNFKRPTNILDRAARRSEVIFVKPTIDSSLGNTRLMHEFVQRPIPLFTELHNSIMNIQPDFSLIRHICAYTL